MIVELLIAFSLAMVLLFLGVSIVQKYGSPYHRKPPKEMSPPDEIDAIKVRLTGLEGRLRYIELQTNLIHRPAEKE